MQEAAVTLSDFFLAGLNVWLAWKMWAAPVERKNLRDNFMGLFFATGLAALFGGVFHGFAAASQYGDTLWVLTLVTVGISGYNLWLVLGELVLTERLHRILKSLLRVALGAYVGYIFMGERNFYVAILAYIPPAILLMGLLVRRMFSSPKRHEVYGLISLILSFVAATIQQLKIDLHPEYLNHNAIYHLMQAIGCWLLYLYGSRACRLNL
jgi:hypothetical protein